MFLVDDLLREVISYFKEKLIRADEHQRKTLSHARKAMRKLASSLSETVAFLERGTHQLERVVDDRRQFFEMLSRLVDSDTLYRNSHESGVCADLRIAQDELRQILSLTSHSVEGEKLYRMMDEIDGYELQFVKAIREFLLQSQLLDLPPSGKEIDLNPKLALKTLKERVDRLRSIIFEIEVLLDDFREQNLQVTW